jgi:hypothetical protein
VSNGEEGQEGEEGQKVGSQKDRQKNKEGREEAASRRPSSANVKRFITDPKPYAPARL